MSVASKWFVLLLSIVTALGADKPKEKVFQAGPISSYPSRQTVEQVTVAADPFDKEEKTDQAFGKLNPNRYGVLPVLVILENNSNQALSLEGMRVEYITPSRQHLDATPAADVPYLEGVRRPDLNPRPFPIPRSRVKKSPLNTWEIEGRAFAAKMLPPGQSASGFFYFQTSHLPGSILYVTGIREAASRRELFYLEIPLN